MAAAREGRDRWSLFLREQRLKDRVRRLGFTFKDCYCPPGCLGGPQAHVGVDPASLPAVPLHGPYVRPGSAMPRTWGRTEERRHRDCRILAEARGTSDILLRNGRRATLRMSLQVHTDTTGAGRMGYFAEMFVTMHGGEEQFIGFMNTWLVDRSSGTDDWEWALLDDEANFGISDMQEMRSFMMYIYGVIPGERLRARDGTLLPVQGVRETFAARWAMLTDDSDILYIPVIWIRRPYTGQRIIDQAFDLLYRLMTGGTLPEPYNVTRPLSVLLEPGLLVINGQDEWNRSRGRMSKMERIDAITRAYERNLFMRLGEDNRQMGRRVEPGDHPAAHDDVSMDPPDPPDSDPSTPSPQRQAARGQLPRALQDPVSPSERIRPPAWVLRARAERAERAAREAAAARAERDAAAAARAEADARAPSPADETQSPEYPRDDLPPPWVLLRRAERAERAAERAAAEAAAAAAEDQAGTEDAGAEDDTLGMYDSS